MRWWGAYHDEVGVLLGRGGLQWQVLVPVQDPELFLLLSVGLT